MKMKVLDLFSGIGGFSLGLERAGMETVAFCEIEPFPQKVLKKHWPDVPIYNDVTKLTKEILDNDGITGIDVICGGFPCQDISIAGNQAGIEGKRSGLWGEMCRIISDIRPKYAIMENVSNLLAGDNGRWFGRVLGDLAEIGYDAEWHCIPASFIGAPHRRERVWIIAYPASKQDRWIQQRELQPNFDASSFANTESPGSKGDSRTMGETLCNSKEQEFRAEPFCKSSDNGDAGRGGQPDGTRILSESPNSNNLGCEGSLCQEVQRQPIFTWQFERRNPFWRDGWPISSPKVCGVDDGIPDRTHRLKALGNAVVPQIPELIGKAILYHEWANNAVIGELNPYFQPPTKG